MVGQRLARTLQQHPELGLDPAGVADSALPVGQPADLPLPVIGDYDAPADVINDYDTGIVIVAFGAVREAQLIDVLRWTARCSSFRGCSR